MLSVKRAFGRTGSSSGLLRATPAVSRLQSRTFFGIKNPLEASPGGVYVTKYRITKPGKDGVDWDDFLLALPEKDQLASTSKEVPLFIKYLRIVTENEGRDEDFKEFFKRAKDGLQVESDVYITTDELLAIMWKNGYGDRERNSLQFTFPNDYQFHYPELAVLFDVTEEDAYKFCMRTRMEKSHIGQLDHQKSKRKGWVRDHWLIFGVGAFIFKAFPFFNYYFVLKGFGTAMWVWTLYTAMNRWIAGVVSRNEYMSQQKVASDVMEGEDKIMEAMKRFANDSKCLDGLEAFQSECSAGMVEYRKCILENEKNKLIAKAQKQLQAILSFEDSNNAKLQESVVREVASEFKEKFGKTPEMADAAFNSALAGLEGKTTDTDPVTQHFLSSMSTIDLNGKAVVKADGTVSERLAYLQSQQENEFKNTFYVTQEEASKVKSASEEALEGLMHQLYGKVGFHVPEAFSSAGTVPKPGDGGSGDKYADEVNAQAEKLSKDIKKQQLEGFKAAFA